MSTLGHREFHFRLTIKVLGRNSTAVRQNRKILKSQIDSDTMFDRAYWRLSDLDHNIEEPIAPFVTGKTSSILNLSLG